MTATLALIIALGGTSYAALRVTGRNIVDGSIRSGDVRNNALRGKDIRSGTITGSDIANGSITGAKLKKGTIPLDRLKGTLTPAASTPAPPALAAGSVTTDKLATGAVGPDQQSAIPTARVARAAALELPNDALVTVPWDREIDDPLDLHGDLAPALRAPIAGVYAISAGAWFSANGSGRRYASIVLNGTLNIASEAVRPVSTGGAATILSLATTRRLAPGDQVTLTVLQNSGTTLKLDAGAEHTSLALTWLGP
ncbi:MAG: hypothetical protein ACSLFR_12815 [Solirubrobacteraceae bacterium]